MHFKALCMIKVLGSVPGLSSISRQARSMTVKQQREGYGT